MKLKLVSSFASSIENNGSNLLFRFEKGDLHVADHDTDIEYKNELPIQIRCIMKNGKLEMLCLQTYIFFSRMTADYKKTISQKAERLLDNDTFKLIMKVDYEDYLESTNQLFKQLENFNQQNWWRYASK